MQILRETLLNSQKTSYHGDVEGREEVQHLVRIHNIDEKADGLLPNTIENSDLLTFSHDSDPAYQSLFDNH